MKKLETVRIVIAFVLLGLAGGLLFKEGSLAGDDLVRYWGALILGAVLMKD